MAQREQGGALQQAEPLSVLMLAAEHGALKGAKVGGMADVIAGIVPALASIGVTVNVVMPDYGFLTRSLGLGEPGRFAVPFRHGIEEVLLYQYFDADTGATLYLLEHPLWRSSPGRLYVTSADGRPFADDADRFALFGVAVAEALTLGLIPLPERLHLHDWHQGFFALLRALDSKYQSLKATPLVLSIHNLALQGTRPLEQESSSLAAWYPWLGLGQHTAPAWGRDPRFGHCFNPLRAAINSADMLHLVSPHYCTEVLKPSDPATGFVGGEGLEGDLQRLNDEGRLVGILNGCEYPEMPTSGRAEPDAVVAAILGALARAQASAGPVMTVDFLAGLRLQEMQLAWLSDRRTDKRADKSQQPFLLTSVGRLTEQKVGLLRLHLHGKSVLESLLDSLRDFDERARFILLGSGDVSIAREFQAISARNDNFIFINHFDLELSAALYRAGSLFLMPSSFEPCGISQMLAMREGQPCLVSSVGGLVDTVKHGENGWRFDGQTPQVQAARLLETFAALLEQYGSADWQRVVDGALDSRFSWDAAAADYLERLYRPLHTYV
ncbi:glycogen/starch synthase [Shewanella sp. 3B26]|uniref:starch synthase n=1 Tax=Shewanella zhuhaiensis TaxID=2919576 RepID=A0AAJ1BKJ3_9GAMM|nr:glycogen/starch synthase [Shewanella zhuhaiensis]MCH4295517.1 glycogen/starch synthase [Shewanella zhuhaiensis]